MYRFLLPVIRVVGTAAAGWVLGDVIEYLEERNAAKQSVDFGSYFRALPWYVVVLMIVAVIGLLSLFVNKSGKK